MIHQETLRIPTDGPGLVDITSQVSGVVQRAGVDVDLAT